MSALSLNGIEPQTLILRFLSSRQTSEVVIDFRNQIGRYADGSKRMRTRDSLVRLKQQNRRTNPFAAKPTPLTGVGFQLFKIEDRQNMLLLFTKMLQRRDG